MASETPDGNGTPLGSRRPRCSAVGESHVYIFVPEPDITAAELAACTELLTFGIMAAVRIAPRQACDQVFASLDQTARRHWQVRELSQIAAVQKPGRLQLPPGVG